jgi:cytochrome b561
MTISSGQARYSKVAMLLHWLIAFALAFQLGTGDALEHAPRGLEKFTTAQFHKTIGITILLLSLLRLFWRMGHARPAPAGDSPWAMRLASITHWGLYAFMILAPLSGWLASSTSRFTAPIDMFGLFTFPDFPFVASAAEATRASLHEFGEDAHGALAKVGFALILLHVIGALRHQVLAKREMVERMLPVSRPLGPIIGGITIVALFIAMVALHGFAEQPGIAPAVNPALIPEALKKPPPAGTAPKAEAVGEPLGGKLG